MVDPATDKTDCRAFLGLHGKRVGVYTLYQANFVRRLGGVPVIIKKG